MNVLLTCKEDYEKVLEREIALHQATTLKRGRGWLLCEGLKEKDNLCFAHQLLPAPVKVSADSVNALGDQLVEVFTQHLGATRLEKSWGLAIFAGSDEQLIQRANSIEKRFRERLQKKMSRVAKLAQPAAFGSGLFVYVND